MKKQKEYTLTRDEIQGRLPTLMICTALRVPMIYQACGLDKKRQVETCRFLVDPAGIEPASKNLFLSASPSADACLSFPHITDKNQTVIIGSSYFMTAAGTSHRSHLPLNDALPKPRCSLVERPPN